MTVPLTLTAAGRAALADGAHRALRAVEFRRLAIGTGTAPAGTDDSARAALRAQREIAAATGDTTVPARIALRADYAPDAAYDVTEVGLFARIGATGAEFLAAYWVAPDAAGAVAAAADGVALVVAGIVEITQSAAEITVTPSLIIRVGAPGQATTAAAGIMEVATLAEALAGSSAAAALTPSTGDALRVPVGAILDYAAAASGQNFPDHYRPCDGREMFRVAFPSLFALIGTTYGAGNGSTTFNLPDLRRRVVAGAGGMATPRLGNTVGTVGGSEQRTLAESQMPRHSHAATTGAAGTHRHTIPVARDHPHLAAPAGNESYSPDGTAVNTSSAGAHTHTVSVGYAGAGQPFDVLQPTFVLSKIIRVE